MYELIEYLIKEAGLEAYYTDGELNPGVTLPTGYPYVLDYSEVHDYFSWMLWKTEGFLGTQYVPVSEEVFKVLNELRTQAVLDLEAVKQDLEEALNSGSAEIFIDFDVSQDVARLYVSCSTLMRATHYEDLEEYDDGCTVVNVPTIEYESTLRHKPIPKTDWSKVLCKT